MSQTLNGQIMFANGHPLAGVRVRIFDKDLPEQGDDDLTVTEGVSDESGAFAVEYERSRYLDPVADADDALDLPFDIAAELRNLPRLLDIYRPYAQFRYTYQGEERQHEAFLRPFKSDFHLPELPPVLFLPSIHGWRFTNRFKGYFIPFSTPALPDIPSVTATYGLCGGMCASALDFALAGQARPAEDTVPKRTTDLHRYIYRRQNDSFGQFGEQIARFVRWMRLPDEGLHGTERKAYDEFQQIRRKLEVGVPVPIGLVYVSTQETYQIWQNHQVLAISYKDADDGSVDLRIYEPNAPMRDDVIIHCERVTIPNPSGDSDAEPIYGFRSRQRIGTGRRKKVRGFFEMPYNPVHPPEQLA